MGVSLKYWDSRSCSWELKPSRLLLRCGCLVPSFWEDLTLPGGPLGLSPQSLHPEEPLRLFTSQTPPRRPARNAIGQTVHRSPGTFPGAGRGLGISWYGPELRFRESGPGPRSSRPRVSGAAGGDGRTGGDRGLRGARGLVAGVAAQ